VRSRKCNALMNSPPPAPQGQSASSHLTQLLLRDLRVVEMRLAVVELGAGRAAIFQISGHPILHIVLQGEVQFSAEGQAQIQLQAGETALFFYGDKHQTSLPQAGPLPGHATAEIDISGPAQEEPRIITVGEGPAQAVLLSCILELAYMAPAARTVRAAPTIWTMLNTARPGHGSGLSGDPAQWRALLHGAGATAFATMLANLHFVHAMREMYTRFWQDQPLEVRAPSTRWLAAAIILLHARPDRTWTVASLAQSVGVSRSRFAAGFNSNMGMPPLAYLTRIRMARAAQLLEEGHIPLGEIARRCGYPVQTSFTRAFTGYHGVPPSEFAALLRRRDVLAPGTVS